jgi:hypothetical protein
LGRKLVRLEVFMKVKKGMMTMEKYVKMAKKVVYFLGRIAL